MFSKAEKFNLHILYNLSDCDNHFIKTSGNIKFL